MYGSRKTQLLRLGGQLGMARVVRELSLAGPGASRNEGPTQSCVTTEGGLKVQGYPPCMPVTL